MTMSIEEYINRLSAALSGYDEGEVEDAIRYYTEIFEDAAPEELEELMQSLGAPEQLAKRIINENGWAYESYERAQQNQAQYRQYNNFMNGQNFQNISAPQQSKRKMDMGLRIVLLFFSSPFWITVYALIFAMIVTVGALYVSLGFILPVATLIYGGYMTTVYLPYAAECFAAAFLFGGAAILLFRPFILFGKLTGKMFAGFSRFLFGIDKKAPEQQKEIKPVNKIALAVGGSAVALGIILAIITLIMHPTHEKFAEKLGIDKTYTVELSTDMNEISAIAKSNSGLAVKTTSDGSARLELTYGKKENLEITEGEKLSIVYRSDKDFNFFSKFTILNIHYPVAKITLYIPEKEYAKLSCESGIGDFELSNITASTAEFNSAVGNFALSDSSFDSLDVRSNLGNVDIKNVTADNASIYADCGNTELERLSAENAVITARLGNIEIKNSDFVSLDCDNDCGDVQMHSVTVAGRLKSTLALGSADFNNTAAASVSAEIDCGDFDFDGKITGADGQRSEIDLDLGDAELKLDGSDYNIKADTDLGDVRINGERASRSDLNGSVIIIIGNDSGDITVRTS